MSTIGGCIGCEGELWKPYTNTVREKHVSDVSKFLNTLPTSLSEKRRHEKMLEFMANHGIRQLGEPRIGIFSEQVRPDPLHCEIKAWQNILDIIYYEAIQRGRFETLLDILSSPVGLENHSAGSYETGIEEDRNENQDSPPGTSFDLHTLPTVTSSSQYQVPCPGLLNAASNAMTNALEKASCVDGSVKCNFGCGLPYLAKKIKEHYDDENKHFNKLPIRLIGDQAITIARYSYRLVDSLKTDTETEGQKLKRLALSKAVKYL